MIQPATMKGGVGREYEAGNRYKNQNRLTANPKEESQ